MIRRHLDKICFSSDFGRQMRFVAGPRQVGKTTLAKSFLERQNMPKTYYNWDLRKTKDAYRKDPYFFETDVYDFTAHSPLWICLDEIHKMPKWKNILKDYFDKFEDHCRFIIAGSARLDWFRKSGDSLAGRYFLFRLFPLSLSELSGRSPLDVHEKMTSEEFIERKLSNVSYEMDLMEQLINFSGFPEPCIKSKSIYHRRWQRDMVDRLVQEDIRDLTRIIDVENVAAVMSLLPDRIGSLLSLNAIREDMNISYTAVKNCISALQLSYAIFLVPPYSSKISRAIKKEKKSYFFDWTRCRQESKRFENYIAVEMKSMVERWNDQGIGDFALYFVRTKDGKESDFLIVKNNIPWCLFEVKLKDGTIAKHHLKHAGLLGNIPVVQICLEDRVLKKSNNIHLRVSASRFFSN
ncbi:MAG: ATP-binding protein [Deltaproteobacteria bacterium]|nr:ATP-binding protein [Deltaproteobacteria bacterium]